MNKIINVTEPFLPPLEEYLIYLQSIWDSKKLTNCGPLHQQLESELSKYLKVPYVSLFSNATIALITALQTLEVSGEVITTPYSFVATAHSILWRGLKPVFVDIDPMTMNLDPLKIESAISPLTSAILPVHCYGYPCDVDKIQAIADKHNLKVIYDAAHAFGVKCHCGSVLNHGNLSVLSFHATKVFNTFEGGAIICHDINTKNKIDKIKNFGFENETSVTELGINGKMSEANAALGLVQLKYIDSLIEKRKIIDKYYRNRLKNVIGITCLHGAEDYSPNFSYFPILVQDEYFINRDELYLKLKNKGINSRRYFYPLITDFPMYKEFINASDFDLSNARFIASRVLCLPIHPNMDHTIVSFITDLISQKTN